MYPTSMELDLSETQIFFLLQRHV